MMLRRSLIVVLLGVGFDIVRVLHAIMRIVMIIMGRREVLPLVILMMGMMWRGGAVMGWIVAIGRRIVGMGVIGVWLAFVLVIMSVVVGVRGVVAVGMMPAAAIMVHFVWVHRRCLMQGFFQSNSNANGCRCINAKLQCHRSKENENDEGSIARIATQHKKKRLLLPYLTNL
jgi:hypothetical protein